MVNCFIGSVCVRLLVMMFKLLAHAGHDHAANSNNQIFLGALAIGLIVVSGIIIAVLVKRQKDTEDS